MSTWKRFAIGCLGMALVSGCNELGGKNADSKKGKSGQAGEGRTCDDPTASFSFHERADRCTREKILGALESFENAQESVQSNGGMGIGRLKSAKSEAQIYEEIGDHCEFKRDDSFIGMEQGGGVQGHNTYEGSGCPISFEQNLIAYTSVNLSACIDQTFSINDEELQNRTGFVSAELAGKSGKKNALDSSMVGTFTTVAHGKAQLREDTQIQPEGENGRMYYSKIEVSFDDCSSTLELEADNWWDDPRVKLDGAALDPATIPILF